MYWLQSGCLLFCLLNNTASSVAQKELSELLHSIESSVVESQPLTNWQKQMELREESWEAFRGKLFEEVILYSTMPADSVSEIPRLSDHCTLGYVPYTNFIVCVYRPVLCVEMKTPESDVTSVVHLSICVKYVTRLYISTSHYMIERYGLVVFSKLYLQQLDLQHMTRNHWQLRVHNNDDSASNTNNTMP